MKKSDCILVTGAAGLAGSAVVEHLEELGFSNVVGLTRKDCDLTSIPTTLNTFYGINPDYVFHAAACVYGIMGNMKNQGKSFLENTLINTSVIEASKQVGVKKIVVMGTNAIYGWPQITPILETHIFDGRPHSSESAYGHAKRGMLAMLEAYGDSYGLNWVYLISGNLYGPRDKFNLETGHVLPTMIMKFYQASISGGDVELWGDGSPKRDFLYSKDLARLVHLAMNGDLRGAVNIGNGTTWSIRGLAAILSDISGVSLDRVKYNTNMPNGRQCCSLDLSRINSYGFSPTYGLWEGLCKTWDWYKNSQPALEMEACA